MMRSPERMKFPLLLLLPVITCALPLRAENPATLDPVTVRQTADGPLAPGNALASVDVMGAERIGGQSVMLSWELLGQMSGVQLTRTRQGAESGKPTLRAFNGEGYINAVKTLIDGVPSNVNSGNQRFIDMIFPLEISHIEVVRGTSDARYGLHNIGGNIDYVTRQGGDYLDARLSAGSFGTRELQFAAGAEDAGLAQNYFFGIQSSDGARQHEDSRRYTLGGKWFATSADGASRLGLTARVYRHLAHEPGFLTAAQLAADRRQSPRVNANDGDTRGMWQLAAHAGAQRGDFELSAVLYRNDYRDDRRVTFSDLPGGDAPRQRRRWDERQLGWLGTLAWQPDERLRLEFGLNAEAQDNRYRRQRHAFSVPTDFNAAPTRIQNDDRHTLDNVGGYLQAVLRHGQWRFVPALRVDHFGGRTHLPDGSTASLQRYGWIHQPKFSLGRALGPSLSLYANWGRTFQVLTGSTAPAYRLPGQPGYRPSINTGSELGLAWTPRPGTSARLALWRQLATDEVANMPATGTTEGLGRTRRQGVDLQFDARLGENWNAWFSHVLQRAEVISGQSADGVSLAGRDVFGTPRWITSAGLQYRWRDRLTLGLQGRMQGGYYIDTQNALGRHGAYRELDASARWALSSRLGIGLKASNLTGRDSEYVWYDSFFHGGDDQPMFSAGPGRALSLSIDLAL